MRNSVKRLIVAIAAGLLLTLTASPAMGFEPPSDPGGIFSCDGGPVAGHPGSAGLSVALGTGMTLAAWNAVNKSEQIDLC